MDNIQPFSVGELVFCEVCQSPSHLRGCPYHEDYEDERVSYANVNDIDDVGPASYWVEETFMQAALDAGLSRDEALLEGMEEFRKALLRGDIRRF